MSASRPPRHVASALNRIPAFLAAFILYAILAEGVIEAWLSGSSLRWVMTLTVLAYLGATVFLWKYGDYWVKAALSTLVLLGITGLSAWRLGSLEAPGGLTIVHLSASILATLCVIGALVASALLVAGVPFLPRSWRIAVLAVSLYCLSPFVLGVVLRQSFAAIASGTSSWAWIPHWTSAAFLAIYLLLPLGIIAAVYRATSSVGARSVQQVKQWGFTAVAIALCMLIAVPDSRGQPPTSYRTLVHRFDLPSGAAPRTSGSFASYPTQSSPVPPERIVRNVDTIQAEIPPARYDLEARSQVLGPQAEAAFTFVRDHIRFEAYSGVLKGAAGTYIARAGNAPDRSLLLAQFLKLRSVPTRFVIGRLPQDLAERLYNRIFNPAPLEPDAVGPAGTPIGAQGDAILARIRGRAARDYAMIRAALGDGLPAGGSSREQVVGEIERHVWVQAQVNGRWLDLDTAFPDAVPGRSYAAPEQTVDALTDDMYQRVTMRVSAETLRGNELRSETALEFTAHAVDLLDRKIFLLHTQEGGLTGAISGAIQGKDTRTPILWVDGTMHKGRGIAFSDQQNAPERGGPPSGGFSSLFGPGGALGSGSEFVAEWIEVEISFPDGHRDVTRRVLVDRGGVAWRGAPTHDPRALKALPRDAKGVLDPHTVHNIWFSAGRHDLVAYAHELKVLAQSLRPSSAGSQPPSQQPSATTLLAAQLGPMAVQTFPLVLLSDHLIVPGLNDSPQFRFYADSPRVFIVSIGLDPQSGPDGIFVLHDLRRDHLRGLALGSAQDPGLVERKIWFGVLEGALEHEMAVQYAAAMGSPMSTVTSTSSLANGQGALVLRPGTAGTAPSVGSPETASRIAQALADGAVVVVPRSVLKGGPSGWWEIAQDGADTRSVMGDFNPSRYGGSFGRTPRTWGVDPNNYRSTNEPGGPEEQQVTGLAVALVAVILTVLVVGLGFLIYKFITDVCITSFHAAKAADQRPR